MTLQKIVLHNQTVSMKRIHEAHSNPLIPWNSSNGILNSLHNSVERLE